MSYLVYARRAAEWAYACTAANQDFDTRTWDELEDWRRGVWIRRAQEVLLGAPLQFERARDAWRAGIDLASGQ